MGTPYVPVYEDHPQVDEKAGQAQRPEDQDSDIKQAGGRGKGGDPLAGSPTPVSRVMGQRCWA